MALGGTIETGTNFRIIPLTRRPRVERPPTKINIPLNRGWIESRHEKPKVDPDTTVEQVEQPNPGQNAWPDSPGVAKAHFPGRMEWILSPQAPPQNPTGEGAIWRPAGTNS